MSNVVVPEESGVQDRILDAAVRLLSTSSRRPAIAELARLAGVSRPTVYRRFADSDAVIRALWERELRRLLTATPRTGDSLGALVGQVVDIADRISTHETLSRSFTTDQALIARYILDRLGAGQRVLLDEVRQAIAASQSGGTVRAGDPGQLAAMTLLITQSAIQSRRAVAEYLPGDTWRHELARALNGYLRP